MAEQEQPLDLVSLAQPHVLVVDDDKRLRELLGRYLADQGFRVTTAVSATEARGKLSSFTFDLLVLDVAEVAERVWEERRLAG